MRDGESERIRLLVEAEYKLLRDGLRWLFTTSPARGPKPQPALTFRTLTDVGEDAFVEAIAATYPERRVGCG